jgi:hypothetical protein
MAAPSKTRTPLYSNSTSVPAATLVQELAAAEPALSFIKADRDGEIGLSDFKRMQFCSAGDEGVPMLPARGARSEITCR